MTPEGKVKAKVIAILKAHGAYYFFPVTGGYGRSGVPDIIACLNGYFIGIECKANGNKPTALQEKNLMDITMAGGVSLVANEQNIGELSAFLGTVGFKP